MISTCLSTSPDGRAARFEATGPAPLRELDRSGALEVLTSFDLVLFSRGSGTAELGGEQLLIEPGLALFGRPGNLRRLTADGFEAARCRFTAAFVDETLGGAGFLTECRCLQPARASVAVQLDPLDLDRVSRLWDSLAERAAENGVGWSGSLRSAFEELLSALERAYREQHDGRRRIVPADPLERFLAAIENDLEHGRTLEEYACELGLSANRLSALCREQLGMSAAKWIRRRIALEASRLLVGTDLPTGEVGERLGFDDSGYFARFVQRETNRTPSAIREDAGRQRNAQAGD